MICMGSQGGLCYSYSGHLPGNNHNIVSYRQFPLGRPLKWSKTPIFGVIMKYNVSRHAYMGNGVACFYDDV